MLVLLSLVFCYAAPSTQPASDPASQSATTPTPEQLEQARNVFRQLAPLTDADKARIEKLIAQLGTRRYQDRQKATEALKHEVFAALPLIRQAANGEELEIAARARLIVPDLESQCGNIAWTLRRAICTRQGAKDTAMIGDLIALLYHDDLGVRNMAWLSLSRLTSQDFGYLASAQPDERSRVGHRAQTWWEKNKATFIMKAPDGPDEITLDLGGGIPLKLVLIPSGKFMMGSPKDENGREGNEGPQREVAITKPFYMGAYTVTQEQYEQIVGANRSGNKGAQNPMVEVTWSDAAEFCKKLSLKTDKTVHLPTEAQWEYACRAGTTTPFNTGEAITTDQANYNGNFAYGNGIKGVCRPGTTSVGSFKPNDWGLYDMHGNVRQWCADWYDKDYYASANNTDPQGSIDPQAPNPWALGRINRGGGCACEPEQCRSAYRGTDHPRAHGEDLGFRVVVDLK